MNAQLGGQPVKANGVSYRNLATWWCYARYEVISAVNAGVCCIVWYMGAKVSKEFAVSISRVEE
jgi:hypothetical protein